MLFTTVLVPVTPSRLSYSLPKSFHFLPQFGKIVKILELSLHFPMANTKQIGINNAYKDAFKKVLFPGTWKSSLVVDRMYYVCTTLL